MQPVGRRFKTGLYVSRDLYVVDIQSPVGTVRRSSVRLSLERIARRPDPPASPIGLVARPDLQSLRRRSN